MNKIIISVWIVFILMIAFVTPGKSQTTCGIGDEWIVKESGWTGHWVNTKEKCKDGYIFTAKWTYPDGNTVSWDNIQVYLQPNGKDVYIYRPECWYQGTFQSDGVTILGTYGCSWAPGPLTWSATVICYGETEIKEPLLGKWKGMGWGTIHLTIHTNSITGTFSDTYSGKLGSIELYRSGDKWIGSWSDPPIKRGGDLFEIKISDDGKTISGKWNVTSKGSKGGTGGGSFTWTWEAY